MSSILKALKKLEQEGVGKQSERVWPDSLQSMKEKEKRIRSRKSAMLFMAFFIVLSVFSVGLIFYFFRDSAPNRQALDEEKQHRAVPDQQKKDGDGLERFASSEKKIYQYKLQPIKREIPEIKMASKAEPDLVATNTQEPVRVEIMPADSEDDDNIFLPKVKDDPRIDLQAIAWAEDTKSRFAVINNRIIREGQTLDGVVVTKIDKDEVSFREGRNEWREKFRIQ